MADDVNDNTKLDQVVKLLQKVSPHLEDDEIAKNLEASLKSRQENEFVRKIKNGGYGDKGLLKIGKITTPGSAEELLKFLQPYSGYKHPTSPTHHVNIRSDDRYSQVFQMRLMQRLRDRLEHIKILELDDPEKANKLKEKLCDIGIELLEALKPLDNSDYPGADEDGEEYLAVRHDLQMWNSYLDKLVRIKSEIGTDEATYNFSSAYDDYVLGSIHIDRYFRNKENQSRDVGAKFKDIIKERFAAIKKFYSQFDKIFQGEGFINLKAEIQAKNTLDRRNKDFEKNVRDKARTTFNIPSHSYVYMDREFFDTITDENYSDRKAYLDNHLEHFNEKVNKGEKVYVIPAAHISQTDDAYDGLDLISTLEKEDNFSNSWRKTGYRKILSKFARVYNISYNDLTNYDSKKFFQTGGDEYQKLAELGIDITRKGDSRAGMPGQKDLIDPEELKNPISGEPINRGSAFHWMSDDDKAREVERFKAFDWSVYPEEMKGLVAKKLKGMKDEEGYYSFGGALKNILKKVQDGDIDIALRRENNVDGMAQAAGVEDYKNASSSEVADRTNWSNLTDYLKIERGVNDQGVNLLKRVYDQYDSDHNWRPENPEAIGIERWAGAVKAAYDYIKDGYNVSAGNYFRKNADGSDGDDVSSIYGGGSEPGSVTTDDYARVREKYRMFNAMMNNGIGIYILQSDVNRLVDFLKNEDNDELFKQAVLNRLIRDQENGQDPNDFQGALARGRQDLQNNESIMKDKDLLEGFPKDRFGMVDYDSVIKLLNQDKVKNLPSIQKQYLLMKQYDVSKQEARNFLKNVEFYSLMPSMKEGEVSHSLDRRRAQKGKDKYHKVVDVPVSRKIAPGQEFDKFEIVKSESGRVGHIVGMIKGKAEDVGSAPIDLANALVDAYNRGGFSDLPIQKLENINTNSMDSIFEKFEKLPLEKQLEIIRNDSLMESLGDLEYARRKRKQAQNKVYKQEMITIWDNQPWPLSGSWSDMDLKKAGFKRFSRGWKISKDKYQDIVNQQNQKHARQFKIESLHATEMLVKAKKLSESLPNSNKIDTIKDILSKHFPVGDIDIQFKAYLALPIPKMMTDFSKLHSAMGHNADARDIVKHYAKNRMPENEVKKLKLNEAAPDAIWGIYKDGKDIGVRYTNWSEAGELADTLQKRNPKSKYEVIKSDPEKIAEGKRFVIQVDGQGKIHVQTRQEAEKYVNYLKSKGVKGEIDIKIIDIPGKYNESDSCPRTKATTCSCESIKTLSEAQETIKAICEFEHSEGDVKGLVYLKQKSGGPTEIYGQFTGLEPGLHGFHIHEFGDLSDGCDSAGGHYNPDGVDHGDIENGHVGDLGNVEADKSGVAKFKTVAERVDLHGDRSVVGRALIIHADEDDLGKGGDEESLKTGNAGERLACGVIRLMDSDKEAVAEDNRGTAKQDQQIPDLGRGFYKREQMPQIKQKHLEDPAFRQKFDLEIRSGTLALDKITPAQVDRVPGLSDSAKKFFAKGQKVSPFIIDRNGNLVNGHHRYDAAKMLGVKRVPIIAVNRTIHELVDMFGPGSDFNLASKTGAVDARKVKGFKGLRPVDTVDPRSVAAQKGWDTRRRRMNRGQQQLDFGDEFKDIRQDMEMEESKGKNS